MTLDNNHSASEGRRDWQARADTKGMSALHEKLDRLMAKSKPSKREQVQQCFRELYPKLEAYLACGKPLKEILAAFNELAQAKVCARTFNDMINVERARRDQDGNLACCADCGRPLRPVMQNNNQTTTQPNPNVHASASAESKVEN